MEELRKTPPEQIFADYIGAPSAPQVIDAVRSALRRFQVSGHADDTAALAVRRL